MGCGAGNHRRGRGGRGEAGGKRRRAVGTVKGNACGSAFAAKAKAGWLLYSMFTGHARGLNLSRLAREAIYVTTWLLNCSTLMLSLFTFQNIECCTSGQITAAALTPQCR